MSTNVRCAVLNFTVHAGTSTQTVTDVEDADGPFAGKVFIFDSAWAIKNTVTAGATFIGGYTDNRGVDNGTIRSALTAADTYSVFNFKALSSGQSLGDHAILLAWTNNFSQPNFERRAYISDVRVGEFDITYDQNLVDGDEILVTVLGGDDLDVTFTNYANGTYTTPSKPQGLLNISTPAPASSGSTSGATGSGNNVAFGFATRDGDYGVSSLYVVNQGQNYSCQHTDGWAVDIDGATGNQTTVRSTVSAWTDTSFTIATASAPGQPVVFSGANVLCAGGFVTQPVTAGSQTFSPGFLPKAIFLSGTGYAADADVQDTNGQMARGWACAASQHGLWAGEATVGNTGPGKGARYLSDSTVLRFGTPNAASTTFSAIASVTDIADDGTVTLTWSVADSTPREILWFVIGEAIVPPTPPPTPVYRTREVVRRRLRRAPIVWSEKGGLQTRVRINLFAVDMQPGVGTSDTPDPLVMIRASKDGGFTWGNERRLTAGRVGEYFERINAWQWGQGRDWVFEVACTDPVTWNLLGAYFDAEGGDN